MKYFTGIFALVFVCFLSIGCSTTDPATDIIENAFTDSTAVRKLLSANHINYSDLNVVRWGVANDQGIQRIIELDLQGQNIDTLTPDIGVLTACSTFRFDNNIISSVPSVIGLCKTLKYLNLAHNRLTVLPDEIGNLTALKTLIVTHNELTKLPSTIGNLIYLERLSADSNKIDSLPSEIGSLASLKILDLEHDSLTTLPVSIKNLTLNQPVMIEAVFFDYNKLCNLEQTAPDLHKWITDFPNGTYYSSTQHCQ